MLYDDDLRQRYFEELNYLRKTGQAFAHRYPKVGARLEMPTGESSDPHVERLIESFAFLTARIQRQLHAEFPEVTTALLGVLYPHLIQPLPSMSIAQFEVDPKRGKLTTGQLVKRLTPLFAYSDQGIACRFRTCYDVTLWPVEISEAKIEEAALYDFLSAQPHRTRASSPPAVGVLRIRITASGQSKLADLEMSRLRFFERRFDVISALYDLLFASDLEIALLRKGVREPIYLKPGALKPIGFAADEDVLPYPKHALPGYRLLQEYFNFPEKFLFFDLDLLIKKAPTSSNRREADRYEPFYLTQPKPAPLEKNDYVDILFLLPEKPPSGIAINRDCFRLGCTPIINLFSKSAEPIRLDYRQLEYRVVADLRRETTTEIHSIEKVSASSNPQEPTRQYEPFYSFRHSGEAMGQFHSIEKISASRKSAERQAFWTARREFREDLPGTDVFLSFLDLDFDPTLPPDQAVFVHALCTNRRLATELRDGAKLQIEEPAAVSGIKCLGKPTEPVYPPMAGRTLWQLISNLSLNHLSLTCDPEGLAALKEMLQLYCFSSRPGVQQQIDGIRQMNCRRITRRMGDDAWRGFCQGTEVAFTFDREFYRDHSAILLASVLRRFLALYASVNSFVEVVAKQKQQPGVWKRWPQFAGEQEIL